MNLVVFTVELGIYSVFRIFWRVKFACRFKGTTKFGAFSFFWIWLKSTSILRKTRCSFVLSLQGCAEKGSLSKEDAAFICGEALEVIPQGGGFIFEVWEIFKHNNLWFLFVSQLFLKQWQFIKQKYWNILCYFVMGTGDQRGRAGFKLERVFNQIDGESRTVALMENPTHALLWAWFFLLQLNWIEANW